MRWIFSVLLTLSSGSVLAQDGSGLSFSPALSYFSYEDRGGNPSSVSREAGTMLDLRLGYNFSSSIYLGVNYMTNNYRDEGISTASDDNVTGIGPQIGFFTGGWHLMFTYYVQTELRPSAAVRFSGGTGTQFDLGYRWMMGSWGLGPYLSMRNLTYSKQQTNGADVTMTENRQWNRFYPYIAIWFLL